MIASIEGLVKAVTPQSVVVEVGGVGILVHISSRLSAQAFVGKMISLHTSLLVREDSLTLFGFETLAERSLFDLLQTVTGIGPKVAQSALSTFSYQELSQAIAQGNVAMLESIPGLGKKGAARLVLELKEKVLPVDHVSTQSTSIWREQLSSALLGLGFTQRESLEILELVNEGFPDASSEPLETLLKFALQSKGART